MINSKDQMYNFTTDTRFHIWRQARIYPFMRLSFLSFDLIQFYKNIFFLS